jgi:hypothetical protein
MKSAQVYRRRDFSILTPPHSGEGWGGVRINLYLLRPEKAYTEATEKGRNTGTSNLQRLGWITIEIPLSRCFSFISVFRCTYHPI